MRIPVRLGLITLMAGALLSAPLSAASAADRYSTQRGTPLEIVGLVDGTRLVTFSSTNTRIRDSRAVQGLAGDRRLVGIDHRVQDGKLYGVGDQGGVYTIARAGVATKVKQLTVALTGKAFGVDFNPVANALRIVSDTGQNLRQPFADPAAATVNDTGLAYTAGTAATGITGAAYTNNDADPNTATTLYDLDTALDQIALQSPANAGTLSATGKLGLDATGDAGFDIYSTVSGGTTQNVRAYATLPVGGATGLYEVNLITGKASRVGGLSVAVTDLAIPLDQR